MAINQVQIPYPDFKLHDIIDPEQFDLNNAELQNKINAVITVLNQITDSITDGSSGADKISLTAISPFISTKLQSFLEEVVARLQSTQDGSSGADFIASTSIPGVTGSTVQQQLESLKSILDSIQSQVNSNTSSITSLHGQINTHKTSADHDTRYYTKVQLDSGQLDNRYYTEVELNDGVLDNRYYTRDQVNSATSNLQFQINTHKNTSVLDHPDGSVTTPKLADGAVTTGKIANGAVTADKIHSSILENVVLSAHRKTSILDHPDLSVTTEKLAPEAVTFDKLGLDVIGYIDNKFTDAQNKIGILKTIVVNVKEFGAKGDGVTDDYQAIKDAVAVINANGGGTLIFPPGTYKIDRYKIIAGQNKNDVTDIVFFGCKNLKIIGYGAKVEVKGDFHRSADYTHSKYKYSYSYCVQPFVIEKCENVIIEGLEIDGNADLMTRDEDVAESSAHGIFLFSSKNVTLLNLHVHHFHTDGIYISGHPTICRNVVAINVKSTNNARQAMSIIQLRNGTFINCEFSDSGRTGGAYGGHAPAAGVDIEPGRVPPDVEEKTGDISFIGCKFKNNMGSQFVNGYADSVENVYLRDCSIIADQSTYEFAVAMACNNGVIENCFLDVGDGAIYPSWSGDSLPQKTTIRNCIIYTRGRGIATDQGGRDGILIENNRIINTRTEPYYDFMPYLRNKNVVFRNNYLFMPKEAYRKSGTYHVISLIENVKLSENNTFETDLVPTGREHFSTSYANAKLVRNDNYISGTAWRVGYNSTWDNSLPYSIGTFNTGDTVVLGTSGKRIVTRTAVPTSGTWSIGDIVYNTQPTAGGYVGWVCTTGGVANNTAWEANTAYTVGQQVNSRGRVYECTVAGTSGSTAPSSTGSSITDGTVTWKYVNTLAVFKGFGAIQT